MRGEESVSQIVSCLLMSVFLVTGRDREAEVAKTSVNEQCCGKRAALDKQLNCKKQCFSVKTALVYHTFDLNATSALSYRYWRVINSLCCTAF